MSDAKQREAFAREPLFMCLLGAVAGLAMWCLFDFLFDVVQNQRLFLWLASATLGFFLLIFALLGSLKWREALAAAIVLSLFDAALLFWAGGRFLEFDNLFEESFASVAWALVLFIGAPFAAAVMRGRAGDYAFLFDTAWNIVVRYVAAWIFVGLFWGVVFLSDALLGLVGLTVIEDILDFDPVPYVLTGAALGLALSVAQDLKAYVSPYLPLRLLRLLLPMVLVVVAVFLIALPVQGLSELFGDFSAAAILMSVAISAIALISSALDKDETEGVQSLFMQRATKLLALLLPLLAGLALWAIWLRVSEYGWTPQRIAAGLAGLLVSSYAVLYGLAVLQRDHWRQMIRQANIAMALVVAGLSALWMTPLMDAQRYSAEAQFAKYMRNAITAEDFPAWEVTHSWGVAGREIVDRLRDLDGASHALLQSRLDRATEVSRWEFNQSDDFQSEAELAVELASLVKIWPEGFALPEGYFGDAGRHRLETWIDPCRLSAERPCVLVFGPFGRQGIEKAMFFVPMDEGGAEAFVADDGADVPSFFSGVRIAAADSALSEEAYEQVRSGGFRIGPSRQQSLWLGDVEVISNN